MEIDDILYLVFIGFIFLFSLIGRSVKKIKELDDVPSTPPRLDSTPESQPVDFRTEFDSWFNTDTNPSVPQIDDEPKNTESSHLPKQGYTPLAIGKKDTAKEWLIESAEEEGKSIFADTNLLNTDITEANDSAPKRMSTTNRKQWRKAVIAHEILTRKF